MECKEEIRWWAADQRAAERPRRLRCARVHRLDGQLVLSIVDEGEAGALISSLEKSKAPLDCKEYDEALLPPHNASRLLRSRANEPVCVDLCSPRRVSRLK